LEDIINKALEKDKHIRYQHASDMRTDLERLKRDTSSGKIAADADESSFSAGLETKAPSVPASSSSRRLVEAHRYKGALLATLTFLVLLTAAVVGGRYFLKKSAPKQPVTQEPAVEDNAYLLYKRARDYLDHSDHQDKIDAAITLLERAVELDPTSAASYAALGEAYYWKNDLNPDPQWMKLASESANRAVTLDSYLASAHLSLGIAKAESSDVIEGEKQLRLAADLDPKSPAPYRYLGHLYNKSGKRDQATQELRHALQVDPKDWRSDIELGVIAYQTADYKVAASHWEQALRIQSDSLRALTNLGGIYHELGRDDEAAAALQRALEIKPDAAAYNNLGTIRFYQGHYDDSVHAFEKTVELAANQYDTWGNLGDAYRWSSNQKDKAKPAYQHAIQLAREEITKHPDQMGVRADLAMYLAKSGDKQSALRELKPVEQALGKEPLILYHSALVYELCGEREKALHSLSAAVKLGQSMAEIRTEPEFVSLRADPHYHLDILSIAPAQPTTR
jgi:serine/threonine-protein kinase